MIFRIICLLVLPFNLVGQPVIKQYKKSLWTPSDTFAVFFSAFPESRSQFRVSSSDTIDLGNNVPNGTYATVYAGTDSAQFIYTNAP